MDRLTITNKAVCAAVVAYDRKRCEINGEDYVKRHMSPLNCASIAPMIRAALEAALLTQGVEIAHEPHNCMPHHFDAKD